MTLSKKERAWIDNAFLKLNKDIVRFEGFLKKADLPESRQKEMLLHFNKLLSQEVSEEEEEEFKKEVDAYRELEDKFPEMSFMERRKAKNKYKDVIKWLKEVQKATKKFRELTNSIKRRRKDIESKEIGDFENNEDLNKMRLEIIEDIINANDLLYVKDPNTGSEVTYESLLKCNMDQLIEIMENNVLELDEYLNRGKLNK